MALTHGRSSPPTKRVSVMADKEERAMRPPDCAMCDDAGLLLELGDRAMAQGENLELRWTCPHCLSEWRYTATPRSLNAERL